MGRYIVAAEQLAACSKALTGLKITSPPAGRVLRPSRRRRSALAAASFKDLFVSPRPDMN